MYYDSNKISRNPTRNSRNLLTEKTISIEESNFEMQIRVFILHGKHKKMKMKF